MQPSILRTIFVPQAGTRNPARLINATDVPLRVSLTVTLNAGATSARLAYSVNDLTPTVSSEAFVATSDLILVLAPKQVLYAVAADGTAAISMAANEAFPVL